MAKAPVQEYARFDYLPVADTRPAMKGGVPYFLIFPIFFGPCIVIAFTYWIWMLIAIPILWIIVACCYSRNFNRPFEWVISIVSGAWLSSWGTWGGISVDPHGSPSDQDYYP